MRGWLEDEPLAVQDRIGLQVVLAQLLPHDGQAEAAFQPLKLAFEQSGELKTDSGVLKGLSAAAYGAYLLYFDAPELAFAPLHAAIIAFRGRGNAETFTFKDVYNGYLATCAFVGAVDSFRIYNAEALATSALSSNPNMLVQQFNNAGLLYQEMGLHEQSLDMFARGLGVSQPRTELDSFHYVNVLESMAHSLVPQGELDRALQHLDFAYGVRRRQGRLGYCMQAMAYYLGYCLDGGRERQAERFFAVHQEDVRYEEGMGGLRYVIYSPAARLMDRMGDQRRADRFRSLHRFHVANHLYPELRNRSTPVGLNSFLHFRNKEFERQQLIRRLEAENLSQQRRLYAAIVTFIVVVSLAGWLLILQRKRARTRQERERRRILQLENENLRHNVAAQNRDIRQLAVDNRIRTELKQEFVDKLRELQNAPAANRDRGLVLLTNEMHSTLNEDAVRDELRAKLDMSNDRFETALRERIPKITPAEVSVCKMIKVGMTNQQIANVMNRSDVTIRSHRYRIMKKAGISGKHSLGELLNEL